MKNAEETEGSVIVVIDDKLRIEGHNLHETHRLAHTLEGYFRDEVKLLIAEKGQPNTSEALRHIEREAFNLAFHELPRFRRCVITFIDQSSAAV